MRALPVEGAEECISAVGRQAVAALGTGAVLPYRFLAEHVFPVLQGAENGLLVTCCGGRHHHRLHAKKTTSSLSYLIGYYRFLRFIRFAFHHGLRKRYKYVSRRSLSAQPSASIPETSQLKYGQ